jgi:hypothetical protein
MKRQSGAGSHQIIPPHPCEAITLQEPSTIDYRVCNNKLTQEECEFDQVEPMDEEDEAESCNDID